MGASNRHNKQQAKHAASCRRVGRMALLTRCGACGKPVVGVVMQNRDRYCIECKNCGYSATSAYQQNQ